MGSFEKRGSQAIGQLAEKILDPVLARRLGINSALLGAWDEIVGADLAADTRPLKVRWQRRVSEDERYRPAVLVVACEPARALFLQHGTSEILARINAFFGYEAIGGIRIEQRPVRGRPDPPPPRPLSQEQGRRLDRMVTGVADDGLREALRRLGAGIMRRGARK